MYAAPSFKHLCLLVVIILIVGLTLLALKWPQGNHKTFSQHAAAYRHTIAYYIALFTITLPLLLMFMIGWFAPTFQLPTIFSALITASALLQYSVTLIPEVGGWKTQYHRALIFCSVILLPPALGILFFSAAVHGPAKLAVALSLLAMIAIMGVTIANKARHAYILLLQAGYYAAFFATILFVTYLN